MQGPENASIARFDGLGCYQTGSKKALAESRRGSHSHGRYLRPISPCGRALSRLLSQVDTLEHEVRQAAHDEHDERPFARRVNHRPAPVDAAHDAAGHFFRRGH